MSFRRIRFLLTITLLLFLSGSALRAQTYTLWLSEADCNLHESALDRFLAAKPAFIRLRILTDSRNEVFMREVIKERLRLSDSGYSLMLGAALPKTLKGNRLSALIRQESNKPPRIVKADLKDIDAFFWKKTILFKPIPVAYGTRCQLACGDSLCILTDYRLARVYTYSKHRKNWKRLNTDSL